MNVLRKLWKKGRARPELVLGGLIAAAIAAIFLSTVIHTDRPTVSAAAVTAEDSTELEERLAQSLSRMQGVGEVQVMITYETGTEIVPVFETESEVNTLEQGESNTTEDRREKSQPATVNKSGAEEALVLRQNMPRIRGVIVIAQGARDPGVRMRLHQAVRTVLNIAAGQVEVFEMK